MGGRKLGWVFLLGLALGLAPAELAGGLTGLDAAIAANKAPPKPSRKRATANARTTTGKAFVTRIPVAEPPLGFVPARDAVYTPAFSAALHRASYGRFPSRINPLVSQPYPATPEYTYLYTPASVITAAPSATSYSYPADNRFLLSPFPGARSVADAYSWNRPWLDQAKMRVAGPGYRAVNRPSISRDPGKKIDNTLDPNGLFPEAPPSELNAALRNLRLPSIGNAQ